MFILVIHSIGAPLDGMYWGSTEMRGWHYTYLGQVQSVQVAYNCCKMLCQFMQQRDVCWPNGVRYALLLTGMNPAYQYCILVSYSLL
jgi:hypothetical protein